MKKENIQYITNDTINHILSILSIFQPSVLFMFLFFVCFLLLFFVFLLCFFWGGVCLVSWLLGWFLVGFSLLFLFENIFQMKYLTSIIYDPKVLLFLFYLFFFNKKKTRCCHIVMYLKNASINFFSYFIFTYHRIYSHFFVIYIMYIHMQYVDTYVMVDP